jgi:hypothetical protein
MLEWEMFQTEFIEKIKPTFCSQTFFFFENLVVNVKKRHVSPRQGTDDTIIQRMRFACCMNKATHTTHSDYVMREGSQPQLNQNRWFILKLDQKLHVSVGSGHHQVYCKILES